MDIIGCAREIKAIQGEIKILRDTLKHKNSRLYELQDLLDTWLEKTGRNEVQNGDEIIYRITKPSTVRLKKEEKEQNLVEVLASMGIRDGKYVLEKLKEAQRGPVQEVPYVRIDSQKEYKRQKELEKKRIERKSKRGADGRS